MKRTSLLLLVLAALALWTAHALARPGGSPASRTGSPAIGGVAAEGLCTSCHGDFAVNSGGSVSLLGVPTLYRGGSKYRLTVHLASTQTTGISARTWGFQLTAVDSANGQGAGTFGAVNATETAIVNGSSAFSTRRYVNQLSGGMKDGVVSPVQWLVDWTAPVTGGPTIKFFVAGLAGDGAGGEAGDWVYTGSASTSDTTTAALPRTWGSVKASYRR
jgi:hypothetical protein